MAAPAEKRGKYGIKQYDPTLYTWSPIPDIFQKEQNKNVNLVPPPKTFCDAVPGSQGDDWITTYVYDVIVSPDGIHRSAYVSCDYVQ